MINTKSIKDNNEFQKVLKQGKWYGADFICMYVQKNNLEINQIGLAIGKKAGKAYRRNHIKRLIRASYTVLEKDMEVGYNIVFTWKSNAEYENCTFDEINGDVSKMLKKAGILR
jgi:ribonuclease P protein component